MTRRGAPARARAPRDPYGIGPVTGFIGPALGVVALVVIAVVTVGLMNGQLPFQRSTPGGAGDPGGPAATPAPPNIIIPEPEAAFPGSIAYAKAGNIWIQTGTEVRQVTTTGEDSMPAFSADGAWLYFVRIQEGYGKFALGSNPRSWYDLSTPSLMRIHPDGSGVERLLRGRFTQAGSTWFYWLRQPTPSPDGKTVTVISDGPNPLQSDVVVQSFSIASKKLTSLKLGESGSLGHQDPAWRPDGKFLLYVKNGRELTRGAPQIYRYDPATKKTRAMTGPGYLAPAWAPDGRSIAATNTDAFGTDIAILDSGGKEVLRVTSDGHSFSPVWSPAGNAVAFLHLEGTIVDLRMAKLDASSGRWAVTETVDLTQVSGLDGASRPSWFVPAADLPAASPGSSSPAVASPSTAP